MAEAAEDKSCSFAVPGWVRVFRSQTASRENKGWWRKQARAMGRMAMLCALMAMFAGVSARLFAQVDCLSCHADQSMTDGSGHKIGVDGDKFGKSVHGSLKCNDCHADIKDYPHPDKPAKVQCTTCHADQEAQLKTSVHADSKEHPCTSCHADPHSIFPKTDARSGVYPLNIPSTCGTCHGNNGMAQKHGLASVYPQYVDSIHGFALNKEGLLVAANCQSCHGSHGILSRNNPKSPTFKANIPTTCGTCHAKINMEYMDGAHGKAIAAGKMKAPVCSDCHTAHQILQPTESEFRMQSTPICGSCHKDKLSTYHDTFHSQLGLLGGYVETARCWDCHAAHDVRGKNDPQSMIAKANLVKTCGRCHAGANVNFVQYQPHADARNRHLSPYLYYVRLFMNLLLASVLTFFVIHTVLWLIRARYDQIKNHGSNGGDHA
ncbi:MAG TPA: cytochrome c3 family protein [Terracidiphilus sp.]|jgi:predicted CXXCH cytochrome family protein